MNAPVLMIPTGLGLDVPVGVVTVGMCLVASLVSAALLRFSGRVDDREDGR